MPRDIAVIGFDDTKVAKFYTPALTTVSLHAPEIGKKAFSCLRKRLDGAERLDNETVQCDLIIRDSA